MLRQQKMFGNHQEKCLNCGVQYVPFHKDIMRLFVGEAGYGVGQSSVNWAIDRLYQEHTLLCSPQCMDAYKERLVETEIARIKFRNNKRK